MSGACCLFVRVFDGLGVVVVVVVDVGEAVEVVLLVIVDIVLRLVVTMVVGTECDMLAL